MRNNRNIFVKILCAPAVWVYGFVIGCRNLMFDWNLLSRHDFSFPIISVGNITVGGTGKTQMVEYLTKLLKDKYKLGLLSRGYGRKSTGYVLVKENSKPNEVGDEMCQMFRKNPDVNMAVCGDRVKGMKRLDADSGCLDVAILDDAFQHRYISRTVDIVMIDYNRPVYEDNLLPLGRLRESIYSLNRSDIIIVTKCPTNITPMEQRLFSERVNVRPHQVLYYTTQDYFEMEAMFSDSSNENPINFEQVRTCVALSGIASADPFEDYLSGRFARTIPIRHSDHYSYRAKDIVNLEKKYLTDSSTNTVIVTTEKDATKIRALSHHIKYPNRWFILPVGIHFLKPESELAFQKKILGITAKNQRNNLLHRNSR